MQVEIKELEEHGALLMPLGATVPKGEVCMGGRFVYATKHMPSKAGYARSYEYLVGRRSLAALFARNASGAIGGNASPKQHIRGV